MHDFDAGGMLVKTDVAGKNPSPCIVIVQVKNGAWVRRRPGGEGHVRLRSSRQPITEALPRPAEGLQAELMIDGLPDR